MARYPAGTLFLSVSKSGVQVGVASFQYSHSAYLPTKVVCVKFYQYKSNSSRNREIAKDKRHYRSFKHALIDYSKHIY